MGLLGGAINFDDSLKDKQYTKCSSHLNFTEVQETLGYEGSAMSYTTSATGQAYTCSDVFCNSTWLPDPYELDERWMQNDSWAGPSLIVISCWVTGIDTIYLNIALACNPASWGKYAYPAGNRVRLAEDETLVMQLGTSSTSMKDGDALSIINVSLGLGIEGNRRKAGPSGYPYIKLRYEFFVHVYIQRNNPANVTHVPFLFLFEYSYIPMYDISQSKCVSFGGYSHGFATVGNVSMNRVAKDLLTVLYIVMWFLAGLTAWVALVSVCIRNTSEAVGDRLVSDRVGLLSYAAALLFALPTMRQLWPSAPPAGTIMDALTIYAQLILVGMAIVLLLLRRLYDDSKPLKEGYPGTCNTTCCA
jgi:hypothetical protein